MNPWLFVPVLYFMQSLPNILVTETFGTAYKNLGVDNMQIALWTGLAALPWSFKMFWGPLVDLNSTKRRWTVTMQILLTAALFASAAAMTLPQFFVITVVGMFLLATFSATHDIACDGLYLMSLDRKRQAAFSGVMATFSRLGRLMAAAVVVYLAGAMATSGVSKQTAWAIALGAAAILYGGGAIWNFFFLPRPATDVPATGIDPRERARNIYRTITVVCLGILAYFMVDAILQLIGYAIFRSVPAGKVPAKWDLAIPVINGVTSYSPLSNELVQQFAKVGACLGLLPILLLTARAQLRNTTMADAFISYAKQPGFSAILGFIIFYRFGEAMVFAMAKLFILDERSKGGMGATLEQVGAILGVGQVGGLIIGGLLGGWFISRVGLRKAFWPLVVCMHTPNLLYVWIAAAQPAIGWLYPVVFIEAFGYGFGFAGYFVYLMHVAQRGKFVTSHYAIGTGLGALFITFATITAGIVQSVFGYKGVFIAACLFTIPGTLVLLFIPMDNEQTKAQAAEAKGDH